MCKPNFSVATFQDGAELTDYSTRWGDSNDIVTGVFCDTCKIVLLSHTWQQSLDQDPSFYTCSC